jgi:hypothetical protein
MTGPELLAQFLGILNDRELPYMVVGSFSSNYHGVPRSTKDADVVLEFDEMNWKSVGEALPDGMEIQAQGMFEMVTATRKEVIVTEGSLFEIEVFHLSDDAFDQERFRRRELVDLGLGLRAWVATAEDVVVQKLRWAKNSHRSKDFEDVVRVLLRQGGDLDFRYIEHWCERHGSLQILQEARAAAGSAAQG